MEIIEFQKDPAKFCGNKTKVGIDSPEAKVTRIDDPIVVESTLS